jgi:uncharacterized OsmC-like protein
MDAIRLAFERCVKALSLRPSLGRATAVSRTRVREGLVCDIEDGKWKLTADFSARLGGGETAPNPGVFGRAARGSCRAIGYMIRAAKHGVPITSLEVEVQADYDTGALLGTSASPPGYREVRYAVTIESPAADADVRRVIEEADAHSPYLHIFSEPQACRRTLRILTPSET